MSKKEEIKDKDETKLKESISYLVEAGCDVCFARNRLYRSVDGKYTILVFNGKADIIMDQEENFLELSDAVAKFILKSRGKL